MSLFVKEQTGDQVSGGRCQKSEVKIKDKGLREKEKGKRKGKRGRKTIRNTPCGQEGICHYRFEKLIVLAYNSK